MNALLLTLLLSADCPNDLIQQGATAPCSGYLISEKVATELFKLKELPDKLKLLEDTLKLEDSKITLLNQKIEIQDSLLTGKDKTIDAMQKNLLERDKNEFYKILGITGAAVAVTAAISIALAFAFSNTKITVAK